MQIISRENHKEKVISRTEGYRPNLASRTYLTIHHGALALFSAYPDSSLLSRNKPFKQVNSIKHKPNMNKKSKCSDNSHQSAKLHTQKLTMSLKYTMVTKTILCIHNGHKKHTVLNLFNVCSNHAPLNYSATRL